MHVFDKQMPQCVGEKYPWILSHDGTWPYGAQHIDTYATERSFTNTRTHRKQALVSLTKARIIFTNRTKKRNPTKPKSAKSTHLDE